MINSITLQGRVTRDVELKKTNGGTSVCEFDIACTRNRKNEAGEYESDFFRCKCFTYTAEYAAKYAKKGSMAYLMGRLQNRSYEGKDGTKRTITEIIVNELSIDKPKEPTMQQPPVIPPEEPAPSYKMTTEDWDDLPF